MSEKNKTFCVMGTADYCFVSPLIYWHRDQKSIKWKQYISLYEVFEQISFCQKMTPERFIVYPKVSICISETFVTLVYSQLILGSLFMVPERSTLSVVIHCLNALFCFILCTRRECGAPNGSTAFLLSAFVLEGFLTSQPKNTQALLLPQGKIRTGNSLIEQKPACIPSRWTQHGMFDHSEKKKKNVWILNSHLLSFSLLLQQHFEG